MNYDTASKTYTNVVNIIDFIVTIIFIVEAVFKIFSLGIRGYFYDSWNRLDFAIVISSLIYFSGDFIINTIFFNTIRFFLISFHLLLYDLFIMNFFKMCIFIYIIFIYFKNLIKKLIVDGVQKLLER